MSPLVVVLALTDLPPWALYAGLVALGIGLLGVLTMAIPQPREMTAEETVEMYTSGRTGTGHHAAPAAAGPARDGQVRRRGAAAPQQEHRDADSMGEFMLGVVGPYPEGSPQQFEVRAFALPIGVREDPVCGSLNAGIAQWLIDSGRHPHRMKPPKGRPSGATGILSIRFIDGNVWVGGASLTCIHGTVQL